MQLCDKDIFDWLSDETWYCHNGFRLVDQDGSDVDMAQKGETMSETKQFSKRIQDILDGLELRTGKKKVQTKEDLKKCFKKICLNAYSAEENGQPRLYRRNDLTQWAAETFASGEQWFYAEPVNVKEPYGKLQLTEPKYVYVCNRQLTEEEFEAVFGGSGSGYKTDNAASL